MKQFLKILNEIEKSNIFLIKNHENEIPNTYPIPILNKGLDISNSLTNQFIDALKRFKNVNSLYIGIPFCTQRCDYCVYATNTKYDTHSINSYLKIIYKEILFYNQILEFNSISKIYFGGGTPSILSYEQIENLFSTLDTYKIFNINQSITFELSPETINEHKLKLLSRKVNRFSIGVQDLNMNVLRTISRNDKFVDINTALEILNHYTNYYNVDIIYGLPNQTKENWLNTLKKLVEKYKIPELTAYNLRIGDNSLLKEKVLKHNEEKIYLYLATQYLNSQGYIQVRPFHWVRDEETRSNWMNYKFAPITNQNSNNTSDVEIGIGASAISHANNLIIKNYDIDKKFFLQNSNDKHIFPAYEKYFMLSEIDNIIRKIIYGIEINLINIEDIKNSKVKSLIYKIIEKLLKYELITKIHNNEFELTKIGKIFYNDIENYFIEKLIDLKEKL